MNIVTVSQLWHLHLFNQYAYTLLPVHNLGLKYDSIIYEVTNQ